MKKLLALLIVLAMLLGLCACGGDKPEEPAPAEAPATEAAPEPAEEAPAEEAEAEEAAVSLEPVTADLGDYTVTILGAEAFEDIDDQPALRFYYDFTNNSDDVACAWLELTATVTQEGYELNSTYDSYDDDVAEYGNDSLYILPDMTIRCISEYTYKPDGGVVTFSLEEWASEDVITMDFDPNHLQGRPAEELEMPVIAEPTWTEGLETAAVFNDTCDVAIGDYEFTEGYDDELLLRVYVDFTNNSDEATSLWMESNYYALQDGVELEDGSPEDEVDEDDNTSLDIEPGETIRCALCYEVRSDSPVELVLEDTWEEAIIGCVIPVA